MRWICIAALAALNATLLAGCFGSIEHDAYVVDIEQNIWDKAAIIEVPNEDTTSLRDISIFVKHQPYESLDSINVSVYTVTPDDVTYSESVTLNIEGCRRGVSVAAHIHEILYRKDIKWQQSGIYKIYIFPSQPIKGIEGVGVIIK